jgi:hypothetical protein
MEEAAEVIQAASKCLHYGLEDRDPSATLGSPTNLQTLEHEWKDLNTAMHMFGENISMIFDNNISDHKIAKTKHFMEYARTRGTLVE